MEFDRAEIIQRQAVYLDARKEIQEVRRSKDADHFLPGPQVIAVIDDPRHEDDQRTQKHDARKPRTVTQRDPQEEGTPISQEYGHASHRRRLFGMHFRFGRLIRPTEPPRCRTEKIGEQHTPQDRCTEKKHETYKETHRTPPFTMYFLNHRRFRAYLQIHLRKRR